MAILAIRTAIGAWGENETKIKHIFIFCYVQWRSKLENLQFPKFQGHCLVLFEVIITGVEGQFFKHISLINFTLKHSIKNSDQN